MLGADAMRRALALEAAATLALCGCRACIRTRGDKVNGFPRELTEMIVCAHCGDKRCAHAWNHEAPCGGVDLYGHNAWVERNLMLPAAVAPAARWYCVSREGVATLCKDEEDANATAAHCDLAWPAGGPHRAALMGDVRAGALTPKTPTQT